MTPTVTVVIPTYARPRQLRACLESLTKLDFPKDGFEVVIVDDGSPAPLHDVVKPFETRYSLRLLRQNNAGPATARNSGAAAARGKYVAFTDDDCAPAPDWLTALARRLDQDDHVIVGGRIENALRDNLYAAASQSLVSYLYSRFNADPERATFFTSNNFALRTDLFREAGGFDTTYARAAAEDREFCDRWLAQGRRMIYVPEMKISHSHHMTLRQFTRQHWHYGCGAYRFHTLRAKRDAAPLRVEPLSFYRDLLVYPFHDPDVARPAAAGALLFLAQAANALGFFWQRRQERIKPTPSNAR